MSINISAKQVEPIRVNYAHIARRIGDRKPASRYQEAVYDVQPTTNFHYPPTWEPDKQLFDTSRTAIVMADWYAFTDPRQYYYTSYVTARARQQEVMENNFDMVEKHLLATTPDAVKDAVRQLLVPLRHYEYGANMNNQDICDRGYGATITSLAAFNGFDRIGMAQYLSRIALLLDENEDVSLNAARTAWLDDPVWQGLRHALEDSFVLDDWFEVMVAQNIVMDGLLYPLLYGRLVPQLSAQGGSTIMLLTQFMSEWQAETERWTNQLVKVTAAESEANAALLSGWVKAWTERMETALQPLAEKALGENGAAQLAEVKLELLTRLGKQGIAVLGGHHGRHQGIHDFSGHDRCASFHRRADAGKPQRHHHPPARSGAL